jgi:hypothetical protein
MVGMVEKWGYSHNYICGYWIFLHNLGHVLYASILVLDLHTMEDV